MGKKWDEAHRWRCTAHARASMRIYADLKQELATQACTSMCDNHDPQLKRVALVHSSQDKIQHWVVDHADTSWGALVVVSSVVSDSHCMVD